MRDLTACSKLRLLLIAAALSGLTLAGLAQAGPLGVPDNQMESRRSVFSDADWRAANKVAADVLWSGPSGQAASPTTLADALDASAAIDRQLSRPPTPTCWRIRTPRLGAPGHEAGMVRLIGVRGGNVLQRTNSPLSEGHHREVPQRGAAEGLRVLSQGHRQRAALRSRKPKKSCSQTWAWPEPARTHTAFSQMPISRFRRSRRRREGGQDRSGRVRRFALLPNRADREGDVVFLSDARQLQPHLRRR